MNWLFLCVIITLIIISIRIYLVSYFAGFEFKYWGDFVFIMFLVFLGIWYKLSIVQFLIIASILLIVRRILQNISRKRFNNMQKPPQDIIIIFKRYTDGPNPYDPIQFISFTLLVFVLIYFKPQITRTLAKLNF